ncbi:hypothetical protein [Streptomyces sp. NPDC016845]|uniref:hypothetical protein n=1 Tax=Streptomyces sp. NPDC016845 TaxID=3364972 RepID=UPI0037A559C2
MWHRLSLRGTAALAATVTAAATLITVAAPASAVVEPFAERYAVVEKAPRAPVPAASPASPPAPTASGRRQGSRLWLYGGLGISLCGLGALALAAARSRRRV